MANINGIEIKAIKTFLGTEGYARQGNVYLDKKKMGFFSEDGNGGCDWIEFECDKEVKELFFRRVRAHYKKYPALDYMKIYDMTIEEYVKQENKLPVTTFEQESNDIIMEYFMEKLLNLREFEQDYRNAVKKGYSELISIKYISLSGNALPLDEVYYTNGTHESFKKVENAAKEKSITVIVESYTSPKDFIIM
ncbi:MAG: hypothetical protein PHY47_09335 [Lachnospiraceae bacterium]|nr:hypothetical protein [Lachnospiraceae bacterium]